MKLRVLLGMGARDPKANAVYSTCSCVHKHRRIAWHDPAGAQGAWKQCLEGMRSHLFQHSSMQELDGALGAARELRLRATEADSCMSFAKSRADMSSTQLGTLSGVPGHSRRVYIAAL